MAPLAQISLNPSLIATPANPPTAADFRAAAPLKHQILNEDNFLSSTLPPNVEGVSIYKEKSIAAQQRAIALPAAAPPAPQPIVLDIPAFQARLFQQLNRMERTLIIAFNFEKGNGLAMHYDEVPFLDGTLPSQAVAAGPGRVARPALPKILMASDLHNLTGVEGSAYLAGHGVANIPHLIQDRKEQLARIIGCRVFNWYGLPTLLLLGADRANFPLSDVVRV